MGERVYILDDEVVDYLDADGRVTDDFVDRYPFICDMLSSDRGKAEISILHGEVRLVAIDVLEAEYDTVSKNGDFPVGFTGFVREGLLDSERELLERI
jgi:hypothetical protein